MCFSSTYYTQIDLRTIEWMCDVAEPLVISSGLGLADMDGNPTIHGHSAINPVGFGAALDLGCSSIVVG